MRREVPTGRGAAVAMNRGPSARPVVGPTATTVGVLRGTPLTMTTDGLSTGSPRGPGDRSAPARRLRARPVTVKHRRPSCRHVTFYRHVVSLRSSATDSDFEERHHEQRNGCGLPKHPSTSPKHHQADDGDHDQRLLWSRMTQHRFIFFCCRQCLRGKIHERLL